MLKSARLALCPLTTADLPQLFEWINDREQVLFSAPYKPVSEAQHRAWFEALLQRSDVAIFGIQLLETGELIGTCQLHSINAVHRTAELQIRLGNVALRGRGYGVEALRLLLKFGFRDLNLHRIFLHVFETNTAAIRAYQKVGFVREGLLRQAVYIDGAYLNVLVMGVLQDEYCD